MKLHFTKIHGYLVIWALLNESPRSPGVLPEEWTWFRVCCFWVTQAAWKLPACEGQREHANLWGFVAGWVSLGLMGRR